MLFLCVQIITQNNDEFNKELTFNPQNKRLLKTFLQLKTALIITMKAVKKTYSYENNLIYSFRLPIL